MSFTPDQCRAARALINWSQGQLAIASKIAIKTIADFERGSRTPFARTLADMQTALETAGVIFVDENGEGPGVRLRKAPAKPGAKASAPAPYIATRISAQGEALNEWQGRATNDEAAAHRLAQHLKTKIEQNAPGYSPDDMVTLTRPNGEIVTVVRAIELVERLKGWKISTDDTDAEAP